MMCPGCGGLVELDAAFCGVCGSRLRARRQTLVGAVLSDQYRIESKIAEGGFGSIYQATHLASGLDVALKVLHAELAADPNLAARFRREGATLSRLHDPHTVATYDVGEALDGTLYIAMELLRGESLHDRMQAQGPIGWRTTLAIVRDVCSALAEAHALGIVHRDLKPGNIHLATNDMVKLLDFGIARVAGSEVDDGAELTRLGQTVGTLEYMAPEQIIGGHCEPRTDIYQLGVLMFEMITGRRPFADAHDPTSMITALLTQSPPVPSSVFGCGCNPDGLDALILRCLEREPEHRFANVRELVAAIVALLSLPDAPTTRYVTTAVTGDEPTWIHGEVALIHAPLPRVTAIGPAPQLAPATLPTMPSFEVPVRGSVAEGVAYETGGVAAISDFIVEALAGSKRPAVATSTQVSPPDPVAVIALPTATPIPFPARVALWSLGLAASGAAIGVILALVAG